MDLYARKIEFIQQFLQLQSEEAITRLEDLLNKESIKNNSFSPMSSEELNKRIDRAEDDFKNGRYKTTEELMNKFK